MDRYKKYQEFLNKLHEQMAYIHDYNELIQYASILNTESEYQFAQEHVVRGARKVYYNFY
jgi:hypothetical protein